MSRFFAGAYFLAIVTLTSYAKAAAPLDITNAELVRSTATSLTFSYTTNIPGTTQGVYGINTASSLQTPILDTSPNVTQHSITLSPLRPCTVYAVKLLSQEATGNTAGILIGDHATTAGCIVGALATYQDSISLIANNPPNIITGLPFGKLFTSISITVPEQLVTYPTTLQIIGLDSKKFGLSNESTILLDTVFLMTALSDDGKTISHFDKYLDFQIAYPKLATQAFDQSTLRVQSYNNESRTWSFAKECQVTSTKIDCHLSGPLIFALTGTPLLSHIPISSPTSGDSVKPSGNLPSTGTTVAVASGITAFLALILALTSKWGKRR